MRTEIEFTLPRGYRRPERRRCTATGTMRLATARDEIEPLRDVEVRQNEAYLTVLLLARTITRLGTITEITPEPGREPVRRGLRSPAAAVRALNSDGEAVGVVSCPACSHQFEVDLTEIEDGRLGE